MIECPFEELEDPTRIHVDPYGHVQLCQGISIGNLDRRSLSEICRDYDPWADPIVAPLLEGGPVRLARTHGLELAAGYADACHLCYDTRERIRSQYPQILSPDSMYGIS